VQEIKRLLSAKPSIQPERLDALLTFAWYQRWIKPDILVAEYALTLSKTANDTQREAEVLFCLGSNVMEQTQYREAGVCFGEAKDLFVALGDGSQMAKAKNCRLTMLKVCFWILLFFFLFLISPASFTTPLSHLVIRPGSRFHNSHR
jgi:hypothetical protein